jgi:hypothetical protein
MAKACERDGPNDQVSFLLPPLPRVVNEPVLLTLPDAAFYGLAVVITQFGLRHLAAVDGALISVPTIAFLFRVLSPFALDNLCSSWSNSSRRLR